RPGSIDTEQKVETAPPQDVAVSQTGSDDAITAERNALQESAPNTVSDDASLRESVPESQIDTAPRSISGEPRGAPDVRESPIETALASVSSEPSGPQDVRESPIETPSVSVATQSREETPVTAEPFVATLPPFIFSGVLLALLPMWNS